MWLNNNLKPNYLILNMFSFFLNPILKSRRRQISKNRRHFVLKSSCCLWKTKNLCLLQCKFLLFWTPIFLFSLCWLAFDFDWLWCWWTEAFIAWCSNNNFFSHDKWMDHFIIKWVRWSECWHVHFFFCFCLFVLFVCVYFLFWVLIKLKYDCFYRWCKFWWIRWLRKSECKGLNSSRLSYQVLWNSVEFKRRVFLVGGNFLECLWNFLFDTKLNLFSYWLKFLSHKNSISFLHWHSKDQNFSNRIN